MRRGQHQLNGLSEALVTLHDDSALKLCTCLQESREDPYHLPEGTVELPFYPPAWPVPLAKDGKTKVWKPVVLKQSLITNAPADLVKLRTVFHMPIEDAKDRLKMGLTRMKKLCREFNIKRWPYRKLASIQELVQQMEMVRLDAFGTRRLQVNSCVCYITRHRALECA